MSSTLPVADDPAGYDSRRRRHPASLHAHLWTNVPAAARRLTKCAMKPREAERLRNTPGPDHRGVAVSTLRAPPRRLDAGAVAVAFRIGARAAALDLAARRWLRPHLHLECLGSLTRSGLAHLSVARAGRGNRPPSGGQAGLPGGLRVLCRRRPRHNNSGVTWRLPALIRPGLPWVVLGAPQPPTIEILRRVVSRSGEVLRLLQEQLVTCVGPTAAPRGNARVRPLRSMVHHRG